MNILKLLFAFVVLSFSLNLSFLKADDSDVGSTENISKDEAPYEAEPSAKKGFLKSLMFWKGDSKKNNSTSIDEISEEELDPRLAKERAKPLEIKIRDKYSLKVDVLKLFETNLRNEKNLNKDTEFVVPLDEIEKEIYIEEYYDRGAPVVMSHLDFKQSVDSYKKKYFSNFNEIGRIKVIYRNITENEIKGYGAYIGANLVLMKKTFEPTIGKYSYDIMFLFGDIKNKEVYWLRNSDEADPIEVSLKQLGISNLNDYKNIITHHLLNPNRTISKKINDNYSIKKPKESESLLEKNSSSNKAGQTVAMQFEAMIDKISQQNRDGITTNKENDNSSYLLKDLSTEELYELQKALVTFRVNAVIGYWEDVITGEVIEIKTMPKQKNQKDITYTAYAILDEDLDSITRNKNVLLVNQNIKNVEPSNNFTNVDSIAKVSTPNKRADDFVDITVKDPMVDYDTISLKEMSDLSINKDLAWMSQDLKIQFSSMGGSGFFIDNEKMVEDARIFFHPAKGLIVVALPNKEYRYYKPLIPDMYPVLEEYLYNNINIKETDVDQSSISRYSEEIPSAPGSTNYFLVPGITLGVIVGFLLIFF